MNLRKRVSQLRAASLIVTSIAALLAVIAYKATGEVFHLIMIFLWFTLAVLVYRTRV